MTWYNTGTVTTTTNSAVVIGSGTAWTSAGLRPGDMLLIGYNTASPRPFEIKSIDSATQITLVIAFPVAVTAAAYVGIPMLSGDRTAITMTLAQQVTKAFTDNQAMQAVWQAFYSGSGTITLTMPDGSKVTGSSFLKLTADMAGKADANDARFGTVNGKTGGSITGTITLTGDLAGDRIITAGAGYGFAVRTGDNNRVEINNLQSTTVPEGTPVNWINYRWYSGVAQTGVRRGGGADIKSYFVNISSGGAWEFLQGGNATASGTWTSGSDERHKFGIAPVKNALGAVLTFRGSTYGKKDGGREVGLIAQDVERACKEAIIYNGDLKFSDGTVIPDFKYLNTSGAAAAFHTEAIKTLFELVELAIDKPDEARSKIAEIKKQSEEIAKVEIENASPWKEDPPDVTVQSTEGSGAEQTS